MRVSIGSDHRGINVKQKLVELLKRLGHEVADEGTTSQESIDYPDIASVVSKKVSCGNADRRRSELGRRIHGVSSAGPTSTAITWRVVALLPRRHPVVVAILRRKDSEFPGHMHLHRETVQEVRHAGHVPALHVHLDLGAAVDAAAHCGAFHAGHAEQALRMRFLRSHGGRNLLAGGARAIELRALLLAGRAGDLG